jgi:hypothetical protein
VVRKALAISLSLAIQVAALSAPLVHAHPDEHATAHHDGKTVHTHWGGHEHKSDHRDGPALTAQDDQNRAVSVTMLVAVTSVATRIVAVTEAPFLPPAPMELAAHRSVEVTHGHDPPTLPALQPRAPPALLS